MTDTVRVRPTKWTMAKTFLKAVFWFLWSGGSIVTRRERKTRIKTCRTCPSYMPRTKRCFLCGCFVEIKSWLPHEDCPAEKWEALG